MAAEYMHDIMQSNLNLGNAMTNVWKYITNSQSPTASMEQVRSFVSQWIIRPMDEYFHGNVITPIDEAEYTRAFRNPQNITMDEFTGFIKHIFVGLVDNNYDLLLRKYSQNQGADNEEYITTRVNIIKANDAKFLIRMFIHAFRDGSNFANDCLNIAYPPMPGYVKPTAHYLRGPEYCRGAPMGWLSMGFNSEENMFELCVICQENLNNGDSVTKHQKHRDEQGRPRDPPDCSAWFHTACIQTYASTRGAMYNCPVCRRPWDQRDTVVRPGPVLKESKRGGKKHTRGIIQHNNRNKKNKSRKH